VSVIAMTSPSVDFVDALVGGATLGNAAIAATASDRTFAVAPMLATLLRANAFTAYKISGSPI